MLSSRKQIMLSLSLFPPLKDSSGDLRKSKLYGKKRNFGLRDKSGL
jgi:hypothetical protein